MSISILIVDDERLTRISLVEYMLDAGYSVDSVPSATQAIQYQSDNQYQVCIVDIRMPGTDGVETIHKLHRLNNETRYIIYTGSPQFALSPGLKAMGLTNDYIVRKPVFDMHVFVELINKLISKDSLAAVE